MPSKSKRKGYLFEDKIKKLFIRAGFKCERLGQANQPDLLLEGFGAIECKCYAKGLKTIYKFLEDNKALIVKWQSRKKRGKEPLAIIPFDTFLHLLLTREVYNAGNN